RQHRDSRTRRGERRARRAPRRTRASHRVHSRHAWRSIMSNITWNRHNGYEDIIYETSSEGIAKVTINRPEVHNAFRPRTVTEMIRAIDDARDDETVGVVIFTGAGDKAFCSGGDQRVRGTGGYVGQDGVPRLNVLDLQMRI